MADIVIPSAASGGVAPIGLLDIQTASGHSYYFAEQKSVWVAALGVAQNAQYMGWLTGQPKFQRSATTQTDTGTISVQNLSGNTTYRDVALAFSQFEFIGALVIYRLFRGDAEQSIFTFLGNITDVSIDESQMDLTLEGFNNYSSFAAPAFNIDVACGLNFAGVACGSTALLPCNQSYGTCSSIERFGGVIIQWDSANSNAPQAQLAQPLPAVARNPARPF